ncbi:MAG: hypothetical protein AMJ73_06580 [candidate division Zixibacteria bacterium SM1_73]|nr:MAG: hypothetical protein AMJ73_06580 [candidate division Zixibacteria bacterium SM1_73]
MKKTVAIATSLAIVFMWGIAVGQNVSVTDYDVAVSTAKDLRIDANYSFVRQGDSTLVDQGTGVVAFKRFYSSLPFSWSVDLAGTVRREKDDFSSLVNMDGRFNKYIKEDQDFFGYGRLAVNYNSEADVLGRDEPRTDVTVGGGYGRFINASPLAKAVRIEEFLMKEGILEDHLPKEHILELAYVIEREGEYQDLHGAEYKPHWYKDMEEVMKKSGLLREEGIGALGALRIDEVIFRERVQDRYYGYDVFAGAGVTVTTPDTTIDRGKGLVNFGFRWARPVAWRTQLDQQFLLDTPLDSDFGKRIDATLTSRYIYELSNRVDFAATHILYFRKLADVSEGADDTFIDNSAIFSFLFYIENYINWTVNLSLDKYEGQDLVTSLNTGIRVDIW